MEETEEIVEAEIGHVLRRRVSFPQPLLRRLQVPVAELVPRKRICGVDRVLEREALDPGCDGGACVCEPRKDPPVLEVLVHLERSWREGGGNPRRGEHEPRGIP